MNSAWVPYFWVFRHQWDTYNLFRSVKHQFNKCPPSASNIRNCFVRLNCKEASGLEVFLKHVDWLHVKCQKLTRNIFAFSTFFFHKFVNGKLDIWWDIDALIVRVPSWPSYELQYVISLLANLLAGWWHFPRSFPRTKECVCIVNYVLRLYYRRLISLTTTSNSRRYIPHTICHIATNTSFPSSKIFKMSFIFFHSRFSEKSHQPFV